MDDHAGPHRERGNTVKKSGALIAGGVAAALVLAGCSTGTEADGGVPQEEGTPDKLTMLVTASPSAD